MRFLLVLLTMSGCATTDPLTREGAWRPTGANDANLRAMVVDPRDLVNGAPQTVSDGGIAADAVARYRAGKVKPLPDSGLAQLNITGGGSAAPAAAAVAN